MDLPNLTDGRRIARMVMAFDELYNAEESSKAFDMSQDEYQMCGAKVKKDARPARRSLYRQVVCATRDLRCFVQRRRFPSANAVAKAASLYLFYDKRIKRDESLDPFMKTKDWNRIFRMLVVLQKCRRVLKHNSTHSDVRRHLSTLSLNYDEYLLCGGKKLLKTQEEDTFDLTKQLGYCVSDLQGFLSRKRLPPSCVFEKLHREMKNVNYINDSDGEDVDDLDHETGEDSDDESENEALEDEALEDEAPEDEALEDDEAFDDAAPDDA